MTTEFSPHRTAVFACPRFTGPRFDDHTLPVEVARDLAAYKDLILALAKHLYLQAHPERQRVPRGFADNFRLDIKRIDGGSTMPVLATVMVASTLNLQGGSLSLFERARDLVAECVAAPESQLPPDFPKNLLPYFNQVGQSLREGEAMELSRSGHSLPAILTPAKRKSLVLAGDRTYEKEAELLGSIAEADWEKSSFRLRLTDGRQITVPMPDSLHATVRKLGGAFRHHVSLKGVVAYDAWDQPRKVVSVETLDVVLNHALAARLDEIAQLQDGWFEGQGLAPNADQLATVTDWLSSYPDQIVLPRVFPTQEGNLLLEWPGTSDPSLDINLSSMQASFHAFGPDERDIEEDFDLSNQDGWKNLFAFLERHIPEEA